MLSLAVRSRKSDAKVKPKTEIVAKYIPSVLLESKKFAANIFFRFNFVFQLHILIRYVLNWKLISQCLENINRTSEVHLHTDETVS